MTDPQTEWTPDAGDSPSTDHPIDCLVNGDRVQRSSVMEDNNGQSLTDQQLARIRERYASMRHTGAVTLASVCSGTGLNKSTVSQVLKGTYPSRGRGEQTISRVLRAVDKYFTTQEAIAQAPPQPTECADTHVALEMIAVAKTCIVLQSIGVAYGSAGIGKTLALRALASTFPGAVLVTICDSADTPTQLFREMMAALRLARSLLPLYRN